MNKAVQSLKWLWIILFFGFVFVGGDFCDICPNKAFSTCVPCISAAAQFKELERLPFETSYGKIFVKVNKTRSRPDIIIIYGGLFKSYFSATGPISVNEIRGFPGISVAEHMDIENVRVVYPFPEQYADATGEKSTNTIEYVLHYNQETKRM